MARLGAIADDVTGAVDLATNLVARGFRTRLVVGAPETLTATDAEAVVIALKSRTAPVADALADSAAALDALQGLGCDQIYVKYCSTFDSTPEGNIGPVCEMVADRLGVRHCVVVPSFPANGRTVYQGHLFVGSTLLAESSMAQHPLTPMRDSSVVRLLAAQTTSPVGLVELATVQQGPEQLRAELDRRGGAGERFLVVDAVSDEDLRTIAEATERDVLVTGGSGLALGMSGPHPGHARAQAPAETLSGPRLVLVGSASAATARQREAAQAAGLTCLTIDPRHAEDALGGVVEQARAAWRDHPETPVVIAPEPIEDPAERLALAARLEAALASLSRTLLELGVRRMVIAGGETSGAVVGELGAHDLRVGGSLGPGLAWTFAHASTAAGQVPIALALKSGNFGADSLFIDAWEALI
ncbi:3-oxo-tetronate kinase [Pseudactinotalea suaedae]|uniref:3-oxo-tetronate kinase n=1 Tax=Pseudactinotalea suaedae TaxID=1524924 RepID=UPI0012E31CD6|nr:3-oxo-tetronate kinase [Pseudactinotalea suaedae]